MVIQECTNKSIHRLNLPGGWTFAWFGNRKHKGLAVIAKSPWTIHKATRLKPKYTAKVFLEGPVQGKRISIELFPVWAHVSRRPNKQYIEQVHLLLDIIERTPISRFTIVAGDFNSNSFWDAGHEINSHSDAVKRFRKLGMKSAYHEFSGHPQGKEPHPTLWFTKNKKKTYHIDYAFLTRPLLRKLTRVSVGRSRHWLSSSDHAPVLVDLVL